MPFMPGRFISISTTSGNFSDIFSTASSALGNAMHEYPSVLLMIKETPCRISELSSTTAT